MVPELSRLQFATLERLRAQGFQFVPFPLYPGYVGVKKQNCAALLEPAASGELRVFGEPCYLVGGQLSVRVSRRGCDLFVWKNLELEVTPQRSLELEEFSRELTGLLSPNN